MPTNDDASKIPFYNIVDSILLYLFEGYLSIIIAYHVMSFFLALSRISSLFKYFVSSFQFDTVF